MSFNFLSSGAADVSLGQMYRLRGNSFPAVHSLQLVAIPLISRANLYLQKQISVRQT